MGLIKEPVGVDFIIQSPPLTEKEKIEISEFIRAKKLKNKSKSTPTVIKKVAKRRVVKMPNV